MESLVFKIIVAFLQLQTFSCLNLEPDPNFDEMSEKFKKWIGNEANITFQEYESLNAKDGALCRGDFDCNWIDENLYCNEMEHLHIKPNVSTLQLPYSIFFFKQNLL